MDKDSIIRGSNDKPAASNILADCLIDIEEVTGKCLFGYPLIAAPDGKYSLDATLVSPQKGIVLFDLIEGEDIGNYADRQDDLANKLEARLRVHRELVEGRRLKVPINVVTFAPRESNPSDKHIEGYPIANSHTLEETLSEIAWENATESDFRAALSAVESISSIRKGRTKRLTEKPDSRGSRLKDLEESIATLDHRQNRAVIETVDGVQRIRGLAGSGKTIVLALKAAYLHSQHPDWRIAVTFNTRSLKGQFLRLINNFCIEQTGEEPDWTKVRVVNAWGAPGGVNRDGIYYEFCRETGTEFHDFRSASAQFGGSGRAFDGACQAALQGVKEAPELYDAILIDEAQDFSPSFLRLCYQILRAPKRLVYAYDELQNLSGASMAPPEEIFGQNRDGSPVVSLSSNTSQDVILEKCYRNSRPVLVTAHALGFGVYRRAEPESDSGLVQMFDLPALWEEIGYKVDSGHLEKGNAVRLIRPESTSPRFLEEIATLDDLVVFGTFDGEASQVEWVAQQIHKNILEDELRPDDIVVVHPDPVTARSRAGLFRRRLFELGIQSHLAGVDTDADVFFKSDTPSVTFTSIYRAKGNEAGMVYVVDAQTCNSEGYNLATLRNRLFTAITRSKAWVRIVGYGPGMQALAAEFNEVKDKGFALEFRYPTDSELEKMRIVHRDLSDAEKRKITQNRNAVMGLLRDLEAGTVKAEDIDPAARAKLLRYLHGEQDE